MVRDGVMVRRLLPTALALACLLRAGAARAQVNAETLRRNLKGNTWSISIDANITGRFGNTSGVVAGGGLFAGIESGRHLAFLRVQGDVASFFGAVTVAKSFGHLRYCVEVLKWLDVEVFVQLQQDKFQRLALRNVEGAGPRFTLFEKPLLSLYIGSSYMFEYERLADFVGVLDTFPGHVFLASRWNNYLSVLSRINDRLELSNVTYAQPRFDAPKDTRVLSETVATVEIAKRISTRIVVMIRHDTLPPTGVKPTDVEVKNSFALTF